MLCHPEVPTCGDCQTWLYRLPSWERVIRNNEPVRREDAPTPCGKCPKGKPDRQPHPERDLSERNWLAYQHYQECRAVGVFPDDPIVRQNAAIIRAAEDAANRLGEGSMIGLLGMIASRR